MGHVSRQVGTAMVVCILVMMSLGCKTGQRDATALTTHSPIPEVPVKAPMPLSAADNRFGFALLSQLRAAQPQGNVFISPYSIATALDVAISGANGETKQAMGKALALGDLAPEKLAQANLDLRQALDRRKTGAELLLADSLWLSRQYRFVPTFLDGGSKFYGAYMQRVDFASDEANRAINEWVSRYTLGQIPAIAEGPPDSQLALVIVNAVSFVGKWTEPFERAQTKPLAFTYLDSHKQDLPMMTRKGIYDYLETPTFQAIRLPYSPERVAMYVFLPAEATGLEAFCQTLMEQNWGSWLSGFGSTEGTITLPRFRAEFGANLKGVLKSMGMEIAFDPRRADFKGICEGGGIWIDRVMHKTVIEVDEEGTRAAAATSVPMPGGGPPGFRSKPFDMVVDRPFFCAIVDSDTGAILFLGAIVSPEAPQGS